MATDNFISMPSSRVDPTDDFSVITPDDNNDLTSLPKAIFVGVAGDIVVHNKAGTSVTLTVAAGYHPIRPHRVLSTGTTATGIIGLY